MSLSGFINGIKSKSFPRSRGDEPGGENMVFGGDAFSPLTRG